MKQINRIQQGIAVMVLRDSQFLYGSPSLVVVWRDKTMLTHSNGRKGHPFPATKKVVKRLQL
jgi:hypothetical protein